MGCKSSRDAGQPGQRQQSPRKGGQRSPLKSPNKPIKAVKEEELKKHKESEIVQFIKLGKIEMVKGLQEHFKMGLKLMNFRGEGEEFKSLQGKTENTKDWNPLLIAVANKKIDIVKYLLDDVHVSLKLFGVKPCCLDPEELEQSEKVQNTMFTLILAIANKDLPMFVELWSHFENWTNMQLKHIALVLIKEKWPQGLQALMKHLTTQILMKTVHTQDTFNFVTMVLTERKEVAPELKKTLEEGIGHSPFTLIAIFLLLTKPEDEFMDKSDLKTFIEKFHLNITLSEFFQFKYSDNYQKLQDKLKELEDAGGPESGTIKKLQQHLEKLEKEGESHEYFKSLESYEKIQEDLLEAFKQCDIEKFRQIVESTDLRKLGFYEGKNQQLQTQLKHRQELLWTPLHHLLFDYKSDNPEVQALIRDIPVQGIHMKYAIEMLDLNNKGLKQPELNASVFDVIVSKRRRGTLKEMWSDNFVNIWEPLAFFHIVDLMSEFKLEALLRDFLESHVIQNLILCLEQLPKKKCDAITYLFEKFSYSEEAITEMKLVMASSAYASTLLFKEIERDNFRKIKDFRIYQQCIDNTSHCELELMSKDQAKQEKILAFLRYVSMLNEKDELRINGQKLLNKIFEIEHFKPFAQNQSLAILEHESKIYEEENMEEAVGNIQVHKVDAHIKVLMKDINFQNLLQAVQNGDSQGAINFLKAYKISDLLYIRGEPDQYKVVQKQIGGQFQLSQIPNSFLNIIQLAIANHMLPLVQYILEHHHIQTTAQQIKNFDNRIILLNSNQEEDETMTLRLAIQEQDLQLFEYLWNKFPNLYSVQHMLTLAQFFVQVQRFEFLEAFLNSNTTQTIYSRASNQQKQQFNRYFDEQRMLQCNNQEMKQDIQKKLLQQPYGRYEDDVPENVQMNLYNLIKDNEVDHLRQLLQEQQLKGVGHIKFDFAQDDDEQALQLAEDQSLRVMDLNPTQLAVQKQSLQCLKVLVEHFGLKQSNIDKEIIVKFDQDSELSFSNIFLPLHLQQIGKFKDQNLDKDKAYKTQENDMLTYILRNEGFFMRQMDLTSFVTGAIIKKWPLGLKTFLQSQIGVLTFLNLDNEGEKKFVAEILRAVDNIMDEQLRNQFIFQIVEETLTRKPYCKQLTHFLLSQEVPEFGNHKKLFVEVRKHLTAEDLMQLSQCSPEIMQQVEKKFGEGNEPQGEIESEIQLIVQRYLKEGKPEFVRAESKKNVRFNENGSVNYFQEQQENQI